MALEGLYLVLWEGTGYGHGDGHVKYLAIEDQPSRQDIVLAHVPRPPSPPGAPGLNHTLLCDIPPPERFVPMVRPRCYIITHHSTPYPQGLPPRTIDHQEVPTSTAAAVPSDHSLLTRSFLCLLFTALYFCILMFSWKGDFLF